MLIDAHTHVHFAAFKNDYQKAIARALDKNIWMITIGTQQETSRRAVEVANEYSQGVYACVGLHPTHTTKSFHDSEELGGGEAAIAFTSRGEVFDKDFYRPLAQDPKTVGIGECGLDYYRLGTGPLNAGGLSPLETKQKQATAFRAQIELAQELQKPLMIHCRASRGTDDAYEDILSILSEYSITVPLISHFYAGSLEMTNRMLEANFNFTFGGVVTFSSDYNDQIKLIPMERLMIETDAPYVAPVPYRGQRNEPSYVDEVAKHLAKIKNTTLDKVATKTVANTKQIFSLE